MLKAYRCIKEVHSESKHKGSGEYETNHTYLNEINKRKYDLTAILQVDDVNKSCSCFALPLNIIKYKHILKCCTTHCRLYERSVRLRQSAPVEIIIPTKQLEFPHIQ